MDGLPKPLLWVPSQGDLDANREVPAQRFIGIMLGWEELWQKSATWSKVGRRLARYSLEDLFDVLSRLSGALWHGRGSGFGETQSKACIGLFGGDYGNRVIDQAKDCERELRRGEHRGLTVLFHDLQIINLVKAALWTERRRDESRSDDLSCLGEALLLVNNLLNRGEGSLADVDPDTPEGKEAWHLYMMANTQAHHAANPLHAMARSFHLYFEDHENLHDHPLYVDLPARLQDATGLEPEQLWSVLFGLSGHWSTFAINAFADKPGSIQRSTYLTRKYDFSTEESDRFFDFLVVDVDDLSAEVKSRYSPGAIRQFDVLPFAKKPLVQVGDRVYCPSYPLLLQKLAVGLHHIHLSPDLFPDEAERQGYLDFVGVVFENYVDRLLTDSFPPASGRYIPAGALVGGGQGEKACDGLILYGQYVVLLEVKATLLTAVARSGSSWKDYLGKVQDIVLDALGQLYQTAERIMSGSLDVPGVPRKNASFLPLVVTLEPMVMNNFIYRELDGIAVAQGLVRPTRVHPWQLLNIEEREVACLAIDSGRNLADVLVSKASDPAVVGESFVNYCHAHDEDLLRHGHHPILSEIFDRLGKGALEWLRSRSLEEERDTNGTT